MTALTPTAAHRTSFAAVWAPWLAAPFFALLPIAGCGVAGGFPPAARHPTATVPAPPAAPVVTVVTAPGRHVAADRIAN